MSVSELRVMRFDLSQGLDIVLSKKCTFCTAPREFVLTKKSHKLLGEQIRSCTTRNYDTIVEIKYH